MTMTTLSYRFFSLVGKGKFIAKQLNGNSQGLLGDICRRHYPGKGYAAVFAIKPPPKRFYKNTNVLSSDGSYEITLDQRKLKTPKGQVFKVRSKPLALAVAAEWDAQKEKILQTNMHLSSLCNTVLDNPNNITKFDLVQQMLGYLDNDTILYHSANSSNPSAEALYELQVNEWNPVITWFCERFQVELQPTRDINTPHVPQTTRSTIQSYLLSHDIWCVQGFLFGVEALKSVILTIACVERFLDVEKAVLLSRLEEEYQSGYWGRVEWSHDYNQQQMQARLAAAVLFIHLNLTSSVIHKKDGARRV